MSGKTLTVQSDSSANQQSRFVAENLREMAGNNTLVVNLGFEKGTILNVQQINFKMPAKGESFPVPTRIANQMVRMHTVGKLAIKGTEHMFAKPGGYEPPAGYKLVKIEEDEDKIEMSPEDIIQATKSETEDIAGMFD